MLLSSQYQPITHWIPTLAETPVVAAVVLITLEVCPVLRDFLADAGLSPRHLVVDKNLLFRLASLKLCIDSSW